MNETPTPESIARLLREAKQAHVEAFRASDGADPDWPIWYADFLHERLTAQLGASFSRSELVYLLITLDRELAAQAPGAEWTGYYARRLLQRYA